MFFRCPNPPGPNSVGSRTRPIFRLSSRIWLLFPLDYSRRPPVRSLSRRSGQIRDYLAQLGAGLPEEPSDISSLSCLFPFGRKGGASLLGRTICLGTQSRPESAQSSSPSPPPIQQHFSVCFISLLTFSTLACQITSSLSNCVRGSS